MSFGAFLSLEYQVDIPCLFYPGLGHVPSSDQWNVSRHASRGIGSARGVGITLMCCCHQQESNGHSWVWPLSSLAALTTHSVHGDYMIISKLNICCVSHAMACNRFLPSLSLDSWGNPAKTIPHLFPVWTARLRNGEVASITQLANSIHSSEIQCQVPASVLRSLL